MTITGQQATMEDSSESKSTDSKLLSLSDFLVQTMNTDEDQLIRLNEFFNSSQIKSELHWFTHRDTLERAASRDDRRLYYYSPVDKIIGGLMVWCESRVLEPDQAQIRLVAVHPDYRGHGIGKYLVKSAIEFARSHEKSTMIADVATDSPAVKFWQACGFNRSDNYTTRGGRDMCRMSRKIS